MQELEKHLLKQEPLVASLLLLAMPGVPSSVLAPSSKARSPRNVEKRIAAHMLCKIPHDFPSRSPFTKSVMTCDGSLKANDVHPYDAIEKKIENN